MSYNMSLKEGKARGRDLWEGNAGEGIRTRARPRQLRDAKKRQLAMNSSQTTLTPNPEELYKMLLCNETIRNMFLNVFFKCFQVPAPVVW